MSANEVLQYLGTGKHTRREIMFACKLNPRSARALLAALVAKKYIYFNDPYWCLTEYGKSIDTVVCRVRTPLSDDFSKVAELNANPLNVLATAPLIRLPT
jgi:predicted transcriptional regulator